MQPHDLLARVVEQLPVGVFAFSADGDVLLWNGRAERLTGWDRTRVLREGLGGLPLDTPTVRRIRDELLAGRSFRGRLPVEVRSGATLYFRAEPLPGDDAPLLLGVLQEVDDVRAGDEAFALLDALWETAPVGLAYFDSELRYRRVNGAVLESHGGTVDERLGRTPEEVHGEVGAEIAAGLREVLADGRPRLDVAVRGRLWHGRGPVQEWRLYSYPVRAAPGGPVVGVGLVIVDITAAARTRRQLDALGAERERALTRYQSLVEATSAAVWIRQPDGSAAQDAPALRGISGQGADDYLGWGYLDAVDPAHREEVREAWRAAVASGADVVTATYRLATDRGYRWFRTRATTVRVGGAVVEWVGTDSDVDDETRARQRLAVLARATSAVNAADDPEAELTALAESVVPGFADLCRVYLVDPVPTGAGPVTGRRTVTRTAEGLPALPRGDARFVFGPEHPVARSVRDGGAVLVTPVTGEEFWYRSPEQRRWRDEVGVSAMLVAPVVSRGVVVAALMFLACGPRPAFTEDDRTLVVELAARASAAVEQAERFQQTRATSLALQAAMLTDPPSHPGVELQARYRPAVAELEVGGDWYDAFPLPGGDLAVGVGDVAGHDLSAAAAMGQLRSMLRALAYEADDEPDVAPSDVVRRLDRVASRLDVTGFTTLVFGRVRTGATGPVFRWANAGHPPPVLVPPGGEPVLLGGGVGVVLGVAPEITRVDREVELEPGSTLLLYTDGLLERRHDPDDSALPALLDLVARGRDLPLAELCDHLLRHTTADTGDDMVVLALRVPA